MDEQITEKTIYAIAAESPAHLSLALARTYARLAYDGWRGWLHRLHWRTQDHADGLTQIREEARREHRAMRQELRLIRMRRDATGALCDLCDSALRELEAENEL